MGFLQDSDECLVYTQPLEKVARTDIITYWSPNIKNSLRSQKYIEETISIIVQSKCAMQLCNTSVRVSYPLNLGFYFFYYSCVSVTRLTCRLQF